MGYCVDLHAPLSRGHRCLTDGDAEFLFWVKMVSAPSLHSKNTFFPLDSSIDLWVPL
jgi:hypothetical protein